MNATLKTLFAASLLASGTASADVICDRCEYVGDSGTYLGQYWPGDRGTFKNANITAELGPAITFQQNWIFDLNNNAVVTLTVSNRKSTNIVPTLEGFFTVVIHYDAGSQCPASEGVRFCFSTVRGDEIAFVEATRTGQIKLAMVPGRYVIRIVGETRTAGESAYAGKLTFAR